MKTSRELYLSLGSNIGNKEDNLSLALSLLDKELNGERIRTSSIIRTAPWGFDSSAKIEDFLNMAMCYQMEDRPDEKVCRDVLDAIKSIEKRMGREEKVEYDENHKRIYHSRLIDIDILAFGSLTVQEKELTVPHPLFRQRDFVLVPLREIVSLEMREFLKI